jgi:Xaa-Pro aminopeptidase
MSSDPCQEQRQRALNAAEELDAAAKATRGFRVTRPLDPQTLMRAPLNPLEIQRMNEAYEREQLAFDEYKQAMRAWHECMNNHNQDET